MTELPPPEPQFLEYADQPPPPRGLAIASMVCGICSVPLLACAWFIAIPAAVVAIVLGFIARSKFKRGEAEGNGMAIAGIACGSSALVITVLAVSAFFVFIRHMAKSGAWTVTTTTMPVVTSPAKPSAVAAPPVPPAPTTAPN